MSDWLGLWAWLQLLVSVGPMSSWFQKTYDDIYQELSLRRSLLPNQSQLCKLAEVGCLKLKLQLELSSNIYGLEIGTDTPPKIFEQQKVKLQPQIH
jgi:hypothetical protein